LLKVWEAYRKQLINEGKVMFASAFDAAPELEQHLVKFKLENKALEDEFVQLKPEILDYFRAALNNYQLDFETSINKDKSNKKAFTPEEKYQKMLEKNPLLAQFRERLDLDVGY
jgi:DNA polymerase-3 subunit gamma/tau